jgi:hypothetical protein
MRVEICVLVLAAACGGSTDATVDAEVFVGYAGTEVINPHGAPTPITNNITVQLGTWSTKADDCTLVNASNDAGALSFDIAGSQCTYGRVDIANGMLADPMLTLHWSKLSSDDERTDYDFTGTRQ